jgi:hypothetical protein
MYAAIFGLFAWVWFGWAQAKPPASWRLPLYICSGISFLVMCAGVYLAITHWGSASALASPDAYKKFGITVGVEFTSAAIGALILYLLNKPRFIVSWVAFVVAVHFLPLASFFQNDGLYVLAALTLIASILPLFFIRKTRISIAAMTGSSMGISILIFAILGLIQYLF